MKFLHIFNFIFNIATVAFIAIEVYKNSHKPIVYLAFFLATLYMISEIVDFAKALKIMWVIRQKNKKLNKINLL